MTPTAPDTRLDDLRQIVGDAYVRVAEATDAVDGIPASVVVEPGTVSEASAILRLARQLEWAVAPRGSGTALMLGNVPGRLDLIVSTTRLDRLLEHAAGDLIVQVEAGLPLARLQRNLAGAGQRLALDPPDTAATIGGIVATNATGSLRFRYGTVRDLLIGITVVLADGTVARAGGKVVKNVAGYDLGRLFTGSLGTLGLVVEATFRLHPIPSARGLVVVDLATAEALGQAIQSLLHSSLVASAVDLQWNDGERRLGVLFESVEPGVAAQLTAAAAALNACGQAHIVEADRLDVEWQSLMRRPWQPGELALKITALPATLPELLHGLTHITQAHGVPLRLAGHAGSGVLYMACSCGAVETIITLVQAVRLAVRACGGTTVVVQAPPEVKRRLDVWGEPGDTLPLMQRVKERFDPRGVMNPGRFVGGI